MITIYIYRDRKSSQISATINIQKVITNSKSNNSRRLLKYLVQSASIGKKDFSYQINILLIRVRYEKNYKLPKSVCETQTELIGFCVLKSKLLSHFGDFNEASVILQQLREYIDYFIVGQMKIEDGPHFQKSFPNNKVLDQTQEDIVPTQPKNKRILNLEGQCKVKIFTPLEFSLLKTVLLILPLAVSGIGVLLLKYFPYLRVLVFFKKSAYQQASYLFIQSQDEHQQIEPVLRKDGEAFVFFKHLKYKLCCGELMPVGYEFEQLFEQLKSKEYQEAGISETNRMKKVETYGLNQHKVEIPNYFTYLLDVLTKPFFLLQYAICIILALQNLIIYVYLYVAFSFTTTTINYVMLYLSYCKIRDIAEKQASVTVIRDSKQQLITSHQLVPGDIVIPHPNQDITFDGIVLAGQVFVNEASLTGQSVPVGKFPAQELAHSQLQNRWVFEGSRVLEARPFSRVIVVNVGYGTRRGRIIRKILTRVPVVPEFFTSAVYFLIECAIIGVILYLATLPLMVGKVINQFVVYRFLDVLGWAFPPSFPIYFNITYTYSLIRLKLSNIFGTEPEKVTEAANIRTFCFDKTGTLTQNQLQIHQILAFSAEGVVDITSMRDDPTYSLIYKLFAACHTVRHINGEFLGDEVDLRMFLHSDYQMTVPEDQQIRLRVQKKSCEAVNILRINQFESKFQSMSVLAYDIQERKYYAFLKGAPELIEKHSIVKFSSFDHLVTELSLGGYRSIAYAYKEVKPEEVQEYLEGDRLLFQKDIIALGIVAFENKLKVDTRQTIDKLFQSDVEAKMITGDNIFIAVQTGFRAGILREGAKVLLLEGRKQQQDLNDSSRKYRATTLVKVEGKAIRNDIEISVQEFIRQQQYMVAIDNDFLMMSSEPVLTKHVKIFARISPQNKAKIVRIFKKKQIDEFNAKTRLERLTGNIRFRVGMCGDGANDLMAIRQADVGLGISDSDAAYGASFTISRMLDVDEVIRESKNVSQGIVDLFQYFGSISFLKIITSIILVSEVSYFGGYAIIYFNFAHSLWLAAFIPLSSASNSPTKQRPLTNFLSMQNHILHWANIIFPTIGFVAAYFYFISTDIYVPNKVRVVTLEKGYLGLRCQAQTLMFLLINLPFIVNAFICFRSNPFREPIYKSKILIVTILGNLIAAIVFFFTADTFPPLFFFVSIPATESGVALLIMGVALIASFAFNQLYKRKSVGE